MVIDVYLSAGYQTLVKKPSLPYYSHIAGGMIVLVWFGLVWFGFMEYQLLYVI